MDNNSKSCLRKRHRTPSADKENKKLYFSQDFILNTFEMGDKDELNETSEDQAQAMETNNSNQPIEKQDDRLAGIADSLAALHKKFDEVSSKQKDTEKDISGVKTRLQIVEEDSSQCCSEVEVLKRETTDVTGDLLMLKNLVIKQSEQIKTLQNECAELKSRSMRNNVLLHNIPECKSIENCEETVMHILSKLNYQGKIEIDRAHRLGTPQPTDKAIKHPRPIVVRLIAQNQAESLIDFGKKLKKDQNTIKITPHFPSEVQAQRQKMGERIGELKKAAGTSVLKIHMTNDRLVVNGEIQRDPLPVPTPRQLLELSPHERDTLAKSKPTLFQGSPVCKTGNTFVATAAKVHSINDVRNAYRKLLLDPSKMNATHNVAAYRLCPNPAIPGNIDEGHQDDGEIGAGKHLRYLLRRRNATNIVVFLSRHYRGVHLGNKRWEAMEQAFNAAMDELKNNRIHAD